MFVQRLCLMAILLMLGACGTVSEPAVAHAPAQTPPLSATVRPVVPAATVNSAPTVVAASVPMAAAPSGPPTDAMPPAAEPVAQPGVAISRPTSPRRVERVTPAAAPASAASQRVVISGHVTLAAGRDQAVQPGDVADTLVYFVPDTAASRPKPGTYTIYTQDRAFRPAAMAVPLGSTVNFVNLDDVRHNVFSVTPGAAFDLGYQSHGQSAAHPFTHAGLVLISCNVHRMMEVDLLVVPSPYQAKVAADGSFILRGLPPGPGTLHFWNPRAALVMQSVTAPATAVHQSLLASRASMATELNVAGRP